LGADRGGGAWGGGGGQSVGVAVGNTGVTFSPRNQASR
jgi:hypothetical protein